MHIEVGFNLGRLKFFSSCLWLVHNKSCTLSLVKDSLIWHSACILRSIIERMILVRTPWQNLAIILLCPLLVFIGRITCGILLLDKPSILPYSLFWTQCDARWRKRSLILWSIETSLTLKLMCCCLLCSQYLSTLCWYRMLRRHLRCSWYCRAMYACNPLRLWSSPICKCLSWNCNTHWAGSRALT